MRDYRKDFPLLMNTNLAYLDNAATAQRPMQVLDAEREFYERHNANPMRGLYSISIEATDLYEESREKVRKFLNADSTEEIIFTRNTTESLNLVAYSYGLEFLKPGDEILVSITEHHSDLIPWQMVCRRTGASLRFIECEKDGRVDPEKAVSMVNDRTKIVAMAQVSNVIGAENPIKELSEAAHRHGAVMVVDGAQSAPHMKVDVKSLGADFFAFSGHKLFGPMGIGVLYGKKELLDRMPPFLSGGEMIETVTRESATYAELPHKFEAGTVNAAGAAGLAAAIDYINGVGFDEIERLESGLTAYTFAKMKSIPHLNIVGSDRAEEHKGILTFTIDGVHPHDVSEILASDNIAVRAGHHCAEPLHEFLGINATTRASLAFYNTKEEADHLIESLSTIRERMGYGK